MSFRAWVNSKVENLSWLDIKLTQLSAIGIALILYADIYDIRRKQEEKMWI